MSLELDIQNALYEFIPTDAVFEATERVVGLIKEQVGATQEKLFNDLQHERQTRYNVERRLDHVTDLLAQAHALLATEPTEGEDG